MAKLIRSVVQLGFPWQTQDPFLFCVHHDDRYPAGNASMGIDADKLRGRNIGQDFTIKDGWRMYHGEVVPGFPSHPHRGFETITLARNGYIDHSDSMGAKARFGHGDCQWMTAGKGIVHSEMFPLVNRDEGNPTELFQIWINLPAKDKMVDPYFTMLWSEEIPRHTFTDGDGRETEVVAVAGPLEGIPAPNTPPNSWAARDEAEVAVWTIKMAPKARFTIPAASEGVNRMLYFFKGKEITVKPGTGETGDGRTIEPGVGIDVVAHQDAEIINGDEETELLMLQGRPIGETVAHYGPFVMNTRAELQQAFDDYRKTRFGGWPWPASDPVHPREKGRFAVHIDGREEEPDAVPGK